MQGDGQFGTPFTGISADSGDGMPRPSTLVAAITHLNLMISLHLNLNILFILISETGPSLSPIILGQIWQESCSGLEG